MTFTVTYRAKDGALREERVESASRAECVAECRRRGISPTKIMEGGKGQNGQDARSPSQRAGSPLSQRLIAVALIVAVVGGVWWWYGSRAATAPVEKIPAKHKVEKPKAEKPVKVAWSEQRPVATNEAEKSVAARPPVSAWRNQKVPEEKRTEAYAKMLEESPLPNTSSNRLFRSGLEQVMGWVFTTEVGDMPPPLPRIPDFDIVHLQEILESKCPVKDGDTEKQADAKTTVEFAKKELKKYLEKGGSPDDFLRYYHDQLKTAYQHRRVVMDQVIKAMKDEPEIADDLLKEANKGLAAKGIKAVVIPERLRRSIENNRNK